MMDGLLARTKKTEHSITGSLSIGGQKFTTLELPWRDNQKMISCIPVGVYKCTKKHSPSRGLVYSVLDVPDREHILIHVGNYPKDTNGCILVGMPRPMTSSDMIYSSRAALNALFMATGGADFMLTIEDDTE